MMYIVALLLLVKIETLETEEWSSGQFYTVIEMLENKFQPKDMMSRAVQKQKLMLLK